MYCSNYLPAKACKIVKNEPSLNDLVKGGYLTKEEAAVYKAAEQNGFNVSITNIFEVPDYERMALTMREKIKIEITKTKTF